MSYYCKLINKERSHLALNVKFKTNKGVFVVVAVHMDREGFDINAIQNVGRTKPYYLSEEEAIKRENNNELIYMGFV